MRAVSMLSLGFSVGLLIGVGCSGAAEELREHTYPPEFKYVRKSEVSSAMHVLADDVLVLDTMLRSPTPLDESQRAALVARLQHMEKVANGMDGVAHKTNRALIDAHMDTFRRDVTLAREAAEADPPNYYLAGSVSGSCLHCHGTK